MLSYQSCYHELKVLSSTLIRALFFSDGPVEERLPRSEDFGVMVMYGLLIFVFNWTVRLLVVQPLARKLLRPAMPEALKLENFSDGTLRALKTRRVARVQKFSQCAMELLFYGFFTYCNLVIVSRQDWSWPSAKWWTGIDNGFKFKIMPQELAAYFLLYGGRYLQAVFSVMLEHRRKDFKEMQVHHSLTLVLVVLSYTTGYFRVGLIMMLVLDPADVPLHGAKLLKYIADERCLGRTNSAWQQASDAMFIVFTITFFATRLVMYPYIIWTTHYETPNIPREQPGLGLRWLLYALLGIQVFWGWLIIRVIVRLFENGYVEDARSDDEGGEFEFGHEQEQNALRSRNNFPVESSSGSIAAHKKIN